MGCQLDEETNTALKTARVEMGGNSCVLGSGSVPLA